MAQDRFRVSNLAVYPLAAFAPLREAIRFGCGSAALGAWSKHERNFRRRLKGWRLLANVQCMSRSFSIEVAKDYFNFASAHFLIFSNGQREPLHGHNYQVSVMMEGELDSAGVVLDFITFKPLVKRICDALDHRTLIQTASPLIKVRQRTKEIVVTHKKQKIILPRQDVILLPLANTSTELLAEHVANKIRRQVRRQFPGSKIRTIEVGVEEARGQCGFYRGEF